MEYCYAVPAGDELYHYGVKGMHWGVRRYQPYPDKATGKFIKRRSAKEAAWLMNRVEYQGAQASIYKDKSNRRGNKFKSKAMIAKNKGKTKKYNKLMAKANQEFKDAKFHQNTMNDAKKLVNNTIKKLKSSGWDVSKQVKNKRISTYDIRTIRDVLLRPRIDPAANASILSIPFMPKRNVTSYKIVNKYRR